MADVYGSSCVLCLNVEELASMVHVDIPHYAFDRPAEYWLCRRCAFAVADAAKATEESPPQTKLNDEP